MTNFISPKEYLPRARIFLSRSHFITEKSRKAQTEIIVKNIRIDKDMVGTNPSVPSGSCAPDLTLTMVSNYFYSPISRENNLLNFRKTRWHLKYKITHYVLIFKQDNSSKLFICARLKSIENIACLYWKFILVRYQRGFILIDHTGCFNSICPKTNTY